MKTHSRTALLFLVPAFAFLIVFVVWPILYSIDLSFYDWNGVSALRKFAGLANWKSLIADEIFWRAFLLRFLISENFESVRFGTFSWLSFAVVTLAFGFSHSTADWPAALVTGALYNIIAYRTKSLSACVLAHALTNLALGLWIVATKQWGFW